MVKARYFKLTALFVCLAVAGCNNSSAIEEPHIEKVHALLEQRENDGFTAAQQYLHRLDEQTRQALGRRMLRDRNRLVAYLGGSLLVEQKYYDDAAPVMAELIVTGVNGSDLKNRMEADWCHDDDPATAAHMLIRVGRILILNLETYQMESRRRAEQFLVTALHLEVNKPFSREDAVTAIQRMSRDLQAKGG